MYKSNSMVSKLSVRALMKESILAVLVTFATALFPANSNAALYTGPNYYTGLGVVSAGSLQLTDNGTTVFGTFTKGSGAFNNNVVIFIDSGSGGFTSTANLYDNTDGWRRSISGLSADGASRSFQSFASGFTADYAIALSVYETTAGYLYHLAGGPGTTFGTGISLSWTALNDLEYTFRFKWADIGETPGAGNGFRFETAYVSAFGNSYFESLEGITGARGWNNTISYTNYDVYGIEPVPEMTSAALGIFGGIMIFGRTALQVRRRWSAGRVVKDSVSAT